MKEVGASVAPITDRNSAYGWVSWNKLCKKAGLRPIFGIEIGVSPSPQAKKPIIDHWTFIAKETLRPINQLLTLATSQFRFEPLLTYAQALAADAYVITGNRVLLEGLEPREGLFVPLSPSSSPGLIREALKRGFRLALTGDNYYPREGDGPFYQLAIGRGATEQTYPRHIMSIAELEKAVAHLASKREIKKAREATQTIIERSTAQLQPGSLLVPPKLKTLRQMCEEGAKKLGVNLKDKVYGARLKRELEMIDEKKFEDYFYIISDLVKWARKNMIVGPARGSSCGSLVCYLLEITTVDPIPFGLIFERFIDINRNDLPDIDIDFSDQRREMIYAFMAGKYGEDHIAKLGTVAVFKPKSALNEAGMAMGIPKWMVGNFADTIIERSSGDSRALQTMEDAFHANPLGIDLMKKYPGITLAGRLEGHPRHHSTHAAGIIVTERPVIDHVPIDMRTGSVFCNKKDAEELNLLKIDALGLTQLSIFEDALELAGLSDFSFEKLPLDDINALSVLTNGMFAGVFQFNGAALQSLAKQITFTELNDIVAITALARPGPMASGGATTWVRRKIGKQPVTYPHAAFEPYLRDTLGVVMYQEQVMEIGRNVGGLSWEDVTALRKAMSKSLGKEFFDQYGDRFKVGARKKGVPEDVLTKVWDDLCAYGSWAFNKSHSVAYGLISYYCCWLKAYYPVEFAAASLTHEANAEKQLLLLRELADEGIEYLPVDPELSTDKWSVGERKGKKFLVGPLTNIKGIGPKMVEEILGARSKGEQLSSRASKLLTHEAGKLTTLFPVRDRVREIVPELREINIVTPQTMIADLAEAEGNSEHLVIVVLDKIVPRDENEEVKVAQRKGKKITDGKTAYLNLYVHDDTGSTIMKISRFDYERSGKPILEKGGAGKVIWALKGKLFVADDFRMLMIKNTKFIGEMK